MASIIQHNLWLLAALGTNYVGAVEYSVAGGDAHTCAIDDFGVVCWGANEFGQTDAPTLSNPTIVAAGDSYTCALHDESVACLGYYGSGQTAVPALTNPTHVTAGSFHACALNDTGVVCWGLNE